MNDRAQLIRHECMIQLYGAQRISQSAEHMRKIAVHGGFDFTTEEIRNTLVHLHDEGLCTKVTDPATGQVRYRITSKGSLQWENKDE